jgi:predicted RNase H-like HicB family nuclease
LSKKPNTGLFAALRGRRRQPAGKEHTRTNTALSYPVELSTSEDGTYRVRAPHFPELKTRGFDEEDALMHARFALEEAIAARVARRQVVPVPLRADPGHVQIALTESFVKILERYWRFNLGQFARRPAE